MINKVKGNFAYLAVKTYLLAVFENLFPNDSK